MTKFMVSMNYNTKRYLYYVEGQRVSRAEYRELIKNTTEGEFHIGFTGTKPARRSKKCDAALEQSK